MRTIEIKQQRVNGNFYKFIFEDKLKSVQLIDTDDIKEFLRGKDYKTGKLPDGRKIIVVKES